MLQGPKMSHVLFCFILFYIFWCILFLSCGFDFSYMKNHPRLDLFSQKAQATVMWMKSDAAEQPEIKGKVNETLSPLHGVYEALPQTGRGHLCHPPACWAEQVLLLFPW